MQKYLGTNTTRPTPMIFAALLAAAVWTSHGFAHEIWIEAAGSGQVGRETEICVCWGHSGHRESGEALKSQQSKLGAWLARPDGQRETLKLAAVPDCFRAAVTPSIDGLYAIGAECQTGILDREFHGMPAKTRIVMLAKALVRVGKNGGDKPALLATELELVPVGDLQDLHPGDVAAAKVLFRKEPIGGRDVVVSLSTLGNRPFPQDPLVEGLAWKAENSAEPQTGEVRFPLIAGGRHLLTVKYMDETPGRYEGDQDFSSRFSHLRKGDSYDRSLYIATLSFEVRP